jgi:hypothetical protein
LAQESKIGSSNLGGDYQRQVEDSNFIEHICPLHAGLIVTNSRAICQRCLQSLEPDAIPLRSSKWMLPLDVQAV